MSKVTSITSSQHFRSITSSSTYTVVDFYADWCGPCKVISPVFEQLATAEAKPGRIVFVKVDVDAQREIAGNYGVSAMPTFLILKGNSVKETIRGANPTALRTAVLSAAADSARGSASTGAGFSGKGQTLGGTGAPNGGSGRSLGSNMPNLGAAVSSPAAFAQGSGLLSTLVRFVGLYVQTLFSFEPANAAEASQFRVQKGAGVGQRVRSVR